MLSPVVELASKHYVKRYCESLYPPLNDFLNGSWITLKDVLPKAIENVLMVEGYEFADDIDSLSIELWVGFDGAGSYRQFQNKDIKINTKNMVSGN